MNYLHWLRTKNKLESHKKGCEKKDFCNVVISSEDTKILKFNQHRKSDKALFIIYSNLQSVIVKIYGCKNNPEKSSTAKVSEYVPSHFSVSTMSSFKYIESKYDKKIEKIA